MKPLSRLPLCTGVLLMTAAILAHAAEPVFTPPPGWLESAPPGMYQCKRGMTAQISRADFRKFSARNQIWAAESEEGLGESSAWVAGKWQWKSPDQESAVKREVGNVKAQVVVLVGPDNAVLDKVITCTDAPHQNGKILAAIDAMAFTPTSYKGKPLVTVMPVNFGP